MSVPIPLVAAGENGELGSQCAVKTLNQAVALRVERCGSCLLHPQPPANLPEDLRLRPWSLWSSAGTPKWANISSTSLSAVVVALWSGTA